jgi:hypothetical protein
VATVRADTTLGAAWQRLQGTPTVAGYGRYMPEAAR